MTAAGPTKRDDVKLLWARPSWSVEVDEGKDANRDPREKYKGSKILITFLVFDKFLIFNIGINTYNNIFIDKKGKE